MNKNIISDIDKDDMFNIIADLYKHIEHSFDIIKTSKIYNNSDVHNILICGMGGSAIGGDFVKTVLSKKINFPIFVNREYCIPKWVNKNTLVIICSYSGNTEETISSLAEIEKLGVKPIVISSGGKILATAINNKYSYIKMPAGIQPRAAFGYSSSLLLSVSSTTTVNSEVPVSLFSSLVSWVFSSVFSSVFRLEYHLRYYLR